jgi:hypothetical protein
MLSLVCLGAHREAPHTDPPKPANELHQSRAALAQLLEYRLEYGLDDDQLCVVVDGQLLRDLERIAAEVQHLPPALHKRAIWGDN